MFAMKYILKKISIQLFLHIAAKKMVSSTHKALTPNVGFSRACCSSDTEQLVQTRGSRGQSYRRPPFQVPDTGCGCPRHPASV